MFIYWTSPDRRRRVMRFGLLNPNFPSVTLLTLEWAARALDKELHIELA